MIWDAGYQDAISIQKGGGNPDLKNVAICRVVLSLLQLCHSISDPHPGDDTGLQNCEIG